MPRDENGDWYEPGYCPNCGMPETGDGKCLSHCSDDSLVEDDIDGNWDDQDTLDDNERPDEDEDLDDEEGIVDEEGIADEP